jgi:hypothetical protein
MGFLFASIVYHDKEVSPDNPAMKDFRILSLTLQQVNGKTSYDISQTVAVGRRKIFIQTQQEENFRSIDQAFCFYP